MSNMAIDCSYILCFLLMQQTLRVIFSSRINHHGTYTFVGQNTSVDSTVMFVDVSSGKDSDSCGKEISPCKSIQFTVGKSFLLHVSSVSINVIPGNYTGETLRADCSASRLHTVIIQGLQKTNEEVQVTMSTNIIKCNVTFINLHWNSNISNSVLMSSLISTITIYKCTFRSMLFSIVSSGSHVKFMECVITNCTGWQSALPIISSSSIAGFTSSLHLHDSNFSRNHASVVSSQELTCISIKQSNFIENEALLERIIILASAKNIIITDSYFYGNLGTTVKISSSKMVTISESVFLDNSVSSGSILHAEENSIVSVNTVSFTGTLGSSAGPVVSVQKGMCTVNMKNCYFNCNQVNGSTSVSPVSSPGEDQVKCTNCTVDHDCPVYCSDGKYLRDGILCLSCPNGTFSSGKVLNITTLICHKCAAGYFSSKPGSNSCHPCKEGTFAAKPGSTACMPCKNDFFTSDSGQAKCSKMTIGCLILSVFVALLILVPLVLLLCQSDSPKACIPGVKQTKYRQMQEPTDTSVNVPVAS